MRSNLFGNPHSQSPSSKLSTNRLESIRTRILHFFKADPEHFDLIFVANATAAIKLVADCVRDYGEGQPDGTFWYGYHADSHTSLVGPREILSARSKCFATDEQVEEWLTSEPTPSEPEIKPTIGLFAFPAQSNMNVRRLPLSWPGRLRSSEQEKHRHVYSLLDAAAFVATAQLDLGDWKKAPDFTALSFYKIFGFPNLGALIVRKESAHVLSRRRYFGGGTVDMVINGDDGASMWHSKKIPLHERLEDGTSAFHNIIALDSALNVHQGLFGSMKNVSSHTATLAKALYDQMVALTHGNGRPLSRMYHGEFPKFGDSNLQGPTIAFNVVKSNGQWIGKSDYEQLAVVNNIHVRTGGLCNAGGIASALDLSPEEMRDNFDEGLRCGNDVDELNGKPTGVIRVSLGAMSSTKDVENFMRFIEIFVLGQGVGVQSKKLASKGAGSIFVTVAALRRFSFSSTERPNDVSYGIDCPIPACSAQCSDRAHLYEHFLLHQIPNSVPEVRPDSDRRRWGRRMLKSLAMK